MLWLTCCFSASMWSFPASCGVSTFSLVPEIEHEYTAWSLFSIAGAWIIKQVISIVCLTDHRRSSILVLYWSWSRVPWAYHSSSTQETGWPSPFLQDCQSTLPQRLGSGETVKYHIYSPSHTCTLDYTECMQEHTSPEQTHKRFHSTTIIVGVHISFPDSVGNDKHAHIHVHIHTSFTTQLRARTQSQRPFTCFGVTFEQLLSRTQIPSKSASKSERVKHFHVYRMLPPAAAAWLRWQFLRDPSLCTHVHHSFYQSKIWA